MKPSRVKLPKAHGVSKSLDSNIKPKKQKPLTGNEVLQENHAQTKEGQE